MTDVLVVAARAKNEREIERGVEHLKYLYLSGGAFLNGCSKTFRRG